MNKQRNKHTKKQRNKETKKATNKQIYFNQKKSNKGTVFQNMNKKIP